VDLKWKNSSGDSPNGDIRKRPLAWNEERLIELLIALHDGLPRQVRAIPHRPAGVWRFARIAGRAGDSDIGCGTGAQTLTLAAATTGRITALDRSLVISGRCAGRDRPGLTSRVPVCQGDMRALPFREASFDLIWSEGAVYIMGFDAGLTQWRRGSSPGILAVSELSWFRPDPPAELKAFLDVEYPALRDIETNLDARRANGAGKCGRPFSVAMVGLAGVLRPAAGAPASLPNGPCGRRGRPGRGRFDGIRNGADDPLCSADCGYAFTSCGARDYRRKLGIRRKI